MQNAVNRLQAEGYALESRVSPEGVSGEQLAREIAQAGDTTTILAGGGDGTVNAVASGILSSGSAQSVALGVLPLGTANDFARALGVFPDDLYAALKAVLDAPAVPVDVGRTGERYFLNVATAGFGSEITSSTPPPLKKVFGSAAYLFTGLTRFLDLEPRSAVVSGPGFEWSGEFLAMAVGNAPFAGGGVAVCPDALLDDGLFDVSILPDMPADEKAGAFTDLLRDGVRGLQEHVVSYRSESVRIETECAIQINLDGEPVESAEAVFDCLPGRLRLHAPPGAEDLFKGQR